MPSNLNLGVLYIPNREEAKTELNVARNYKGQKKRRKKLREIEIPISPPFLQVNNLNINNPEGGTPSYVSKEESSKLAS